MGTMRAIMHDQLGNPIDELQIPEATRPEAIIITLPAMAPGVPEQRLGFVFSHHEVDPADQEAAPTLHYREARVLFFNPKPKSRLFVPPGIQGRVS